LDVKAYHALGDLGLIPEKTELLYGQIFHKTPKSPFHSYLLQLLLEIPRAAVPAGFIVRTEQPITCADSEPEPDLSVVRGGIADFRHQHPGTAELVIEICVSTHDYDRSKLRAYASAGVKELVIEICVSTHDYDRSKLRAYASAGVKECWLILAPERQIEVHRQPQGEQFAERTTQGPGGKVSSTAVPAFAVELDELFVD